jgi:hypothetical protein
MRFLPCIQALSLSSLTGTTNRAFTVAAMLFHPTDIANKDCATALGWSLLRRENIKSTDIIVIRS